MRRSGRSTGRSARIAAAALAGICLPAAAQDEAADGETTFNNYCRQCHVVEEGENRLGPSLYGVVGREAGSIEGFQYSESMKNAGFTWTPETLDEFIADPEAVVPGNRMKPFEGVPDEDDRAAIVAYLESQGGSSADGEEAAE